MVRRWLSDKGLGEKGLGEKGFCERGVVRGGVLVHTTWVCLCVLHLLCINYTHAIIHGLMDTHLYSPVHFIMHRTQNCQT